MDAKHPLHVLMTADCVGGVWTYALELIRALEPYGVRVSLATMGAPLNEQQRQEAETLPNATLYESSYKLEWMEHPWDEVQEAGRWLLELTQELQPDLIHLNNFAHGALPFGKPVLMVFHSCVISWWEAVKGEAAPESWSRYKTEVQAGLQEADKVIAPTAAILAEAVRHYGPFKEQQVIHNGRKLTAFAADNLRETCASEGSMAEAKEPYIFSMGRLWDEAKNLSLLTEIAAELPWSVYVAGDAKHPATGQELHMPNVHFLGGLSSAEIQQWLQRSSLYVLPVRYEPFGLSMLEAAQAGCALVVGDIPTQREIWADAAIYVAPDSAEQLREVLQELIQNEDKRAELAQKAQQRAQSFSPEKMAAAYFRVYQELLENDAANVNETKASIPAEAATV